jgi:hypothetical protein
MPPAGPELARLPLHVAVREWPELLAVLRGRGLDAAALGGTLVADVCAAAGAELDELRLATAWREG